jgi:SAM-dependent methyltransferase
MMLETEITHREHEYDSRFLPMLQRMQQDHFWYRGRHRFLLDAVHRSVRKSRFQAQAYRLVDLGGGCGGWLRYLLKEKQFAVADAALADSSSAALEMAGECLPPHVERRQVDLMDLPWSEEWDMAFLLDVLEHLPHQEAVLKQIHESLVPGGLLFVTVPALRSFWSWNDDVSRHLRRYSRRDFAELSRACGFRLLDARYFMFLLSPLLLAARFATSSRVRSQTEAQTHDLLAKMHAIPHPIVNEALAVAFRAETPLGHLVRFPWGTSLLAVLERLHP